MEIDLFLLFIILSLSLAFFFTSVELAYFSVNLIKIEVDRSSGLWWTKLLHFCTLSPSYFIKSIHLARFLCLFSFCTLVFFQYYSEINSLFFAIIFFLAVFILFWLVADFAPNLFFRNKAYSYLAFSSPIFFVFYCLLFPLVYLFMGHKQYINHPSKQGFDKYLDGFSGLENQVAAEKSELKMIQNVMELKRSKVRNCMVPRKEIVQIDIKAEMEELKNLFIKTGFSKILVHKDQIGNIIGYVHAYDLFKEQAPLHIEEIIRKISSVPESLAVNTLLKDMTTKHLSLCLVYNEFGEVSGLVSLEDLMEEIFGNIEDEFDTNDSVEQIVGKDKYIFSTRLEINYLNEKYQLQIPKFDEYETLSGFVSSHLQRIPLVNEELKISNFLIKILQASPTKVEKISLQIVDD